MKKNLFLLVILLNSLLGEEAVPLVNDPAPLSWEALMAPNLTFDKRLPIAMSRENREKWVEDPVLLRQEVENVKKRMAKKTFPWKAWAFWGTIACLFYLFRKPLLEMGRVLIRFFQHPLEPKEEALQSIQRLKSLYTRNPIPSAEYYTYLSDVLRHYLDQQYHFDSKHQSTQEFLEILSRKKIFNAISKVLLEEFFKGMDLVKFGHFRPTADEFKQAVEAAEQFIEKN